jgi:hypothetical protein
MDERSMVPAPPCMAIAGLVIDGASWRFFQKKSSEVLHNSITQLFLQSL